MIDQRIQSIVSVKGQCGRTVEGGMQLRHLRYFVKIVDAGSFSRAAASAHVAQPALSQQIAELEARLGLQLLLRSARGVRPTAAGEVLYREAVSILQQMDRLPGIVRSSAGEIEGAVSLGMSSTVAATLAGPFMEICRSQLPGVALKFSVSDSESLRGRLAGHVLDLALLFEDELVPAFRRNALFRQRLYLVRAPSAFGDRPSISVPELARVPLVLPEPPNVVRGMLEREFDKHGLKANIVAEADVLSSIMSAVKNGIGGTVLPRGQSADIGADLPAPIAIEPALYLTASILSSGDYPLSYAGEAVHKALDAFVRSQMSDQIGAEWFPAGP